MFLYFISLGAKVKKENAVKNERKCCKNLERKKQYRIFVVK